MGFVDSFINTYTQQQQLKQQRQEWETQQALREADAIARQQEMRERAIDRDRRFKMEEQERIWKNEDRDEERVRRIKKDKQEDEMHRLDKSLKLQSMGYTQNEADAQINKTTAPPRFRPKPLKKQIGVAEGDAFAQVPVDMMKQLSNVLPQLFANHPAGQAVQQGISQFQNAAGPELRQFGEKAVSQEQDAINLANEVLKEQNALGLDVARAQGNAVSPLFEQCAEKLNLQRDALNLKENEGIAALRFKREQLQQKAENDFREIQQKYDAEAAKMTRHRDVMEVKKTHEANVAKNVASLVTSRKIMAQVAQINASTSQGQLAQTRRANDRLAASAGPDGLRALAETRKVTSEYLKHLSGIKDGLLSEQKMLMGRIAESEVAYNKLGFKGPEMTSKMMQLRDELQKVEANLAVASKELSDGIPKLLAIGAKLQDPSTGKVVAPPKPGAGAISDVEKNKAILRSMFIKKN